MLEALASAHLHGDGPFTKRCESLLTKMHAVRAMLTHSCTGALELAALMLDIRAGDEVIVPSFTFVSSASAFVLRGAKIVFVDVDFATGNVAVEAVANAITPKTKAVVCVHYAGVACDMAGLMELCDAHGVALVEDAAQAIGAKYLNRPLGSIGRFGTLSFHQTKNLGCGEGGALLVRDDTDTRNALFRREKGTNRVDFMAGKVDKYQWVDLGSSFLPSELQAAMLCAQLENIEAILSARMALWQVYARGLESCSRKHGFSLPMVPEYAQHNAHIFALRMPDESSRDQLLEYLQAHGIQASSHYVPLHLSPAGQQYGRCGDECASSVALSARIVRLPLNANIDVSEAERIVSLVEAYFAA